MNALLNSVKYKGNCLVSGKESEIEIVSGKKGSGIVFVNSETQETFKAGLDNILDTTHMTVLGTPGFNIKVTEHLLATLALIGINDVEIHLNGDEIPIGDGSARVFYDLLKASYSGNKVEPKRYSIEKPLYFNHEHTSISAIPSDGFRVTYAVNYKNSPFSNSWYAWDASKNGIEDIIDARTFGYTKDLPLYQSQGLALGVTKDNTVGLNDDGTFTTDLRYSNEPIRHKVLDAIGDLYLTGINPLSLNVHLIVIECGHFQHVQMAKLIKSSIID